MESQEAEIMEVPVRDRRGRQRLSHERWAQLLRIRPAGCPFESGGRIIMHQA